MSEEKTTPEERLQNIDALVEQTISALYDVTSWLREGNVDQAYAALECASEPLSDIEDWLNEAADEAAEQASHTGEKT